MLILSYFRLQRRSLREAICDANAKFFAYLSRILLTLMPSGFWLRLALLVELLFVRLLMAIVNSLQAL